MDTESIIRLRMLNQRLAGAPLDRPEEVVHWLGAVQAQDYPAARWALGLRLRDAADASLELAFDSGAILRTHVLRPTWHFLVPEDIRWVLSLTAPRVHAANGTMYRRLELDPDLLIRSSAVLETALAGGQALTREELRGALERAGIAAWNGQRLAYIVMHAELEGVICSGPRRGKQFTYRLLEQRVPPARTLARDEALGELVRRYFTSHGPATAQDFAWWSGLTIADTRDGLETVKSQLVEEELDGKKYWFSPTMPPARDQAPRAYLLPNFDEYGSYQDRSAILDPANADHLAFSHPLVIDGRITGAWRRTIHPRTVAVEISTFTPLGEPELQAVASAVERFSNFLGLPVIISPQRPQRSD